MQTIYTGQRVRLRPFSSGEELYHLSCIIDARTNPWWGMWWYPEPGELREFEPAGLLVSKGVSVFAVERIDTGELIGLEAAILKSHWPLVGEVGTFIDGKHQKQGFGVEAKQLCMYFMFENFRLNQVWGVTLEHHAPARRGLELAGLSYLGSKRRSFLSQGTMRDIVFYRMWRQEWEQHQLRSIVRRGA